MTELAKILQRLDHEQRLKCVVDGETTRDGAPAPLCPSLISRPDHMCAGCSARILLASQCKTCKGTGEYLYPDSAMGMGAGGQTMTTGPCPGTKTRPDQSDCPFLEPPA